MTREHITHYFESLNCPVCGRPMTTRYGATFGCFADGIKVDFSGVMKGHLKQGRSHPTLGQPRFHPHRP